MAAPRLGSCHNTARTDNYWRVSHTAEQIIISSKKIWKNVNRHKHSSYSYLLLKPLITVPFVQILTVFMTIISFLFIPLSLRETSPAYIYCCPWRFWQILTCPVFHFSYELLTIHWKTFSWTNLKYILKKTIGMEVIMLGKLWNLVLYKWEGAGRKLQYTYPGPVCWMVRLSYRDVGTTGRPLFCWCSSVFSSLATVAQGLWTSNVSKHFHSMDGNHILRTKFSGFRFVIRSEIHPLILKTCNGYLCNVRSVGFHLLLCLETSIFWSCRKLGSRR